MSHKTVAEPVHQRREQISPGITVMDMNKRRAHAYSASERWLAAYGRFHLDLMNLRAFYATTTSSLEFGKAQVEKELRKGMEEVANSPALGALIKASPMAHEDFQSRIVDAMAKRSARIARDSVDSAALVFAHTLLDGLLSECCHIGFAANPKDWHRYIEKRKVEAGSLLTSTPEELLDNLALEAICQLERESMFKRLEKLNEICAPRLNGAKIPTGWITEEAMEDFDRVRQRIIHKRPFSSRRVNPQQRGLFAKDVGLSTLMLLAQAYGIPKDIKVELKLKSERDMLRLFALFRREFPEIYSMLEEMDGDEPWLGDLRQLGN